MILDRTHRPWAAITVIVMIAATAIYWVYAVLTPTGPQGGTLVGLGFGAASALMMLLAGLLAIQRRMLLFPVGTRQAWLRAHIWFGLLCIPFALFHTGFELGGAIEKWLWFLTATVVGSGVWGLVMQQVIPRYLMLRVPEETFVEQIPHRLKVLKVECDLAVADAVGPMALPDAPQFKAFVEADRLFQEVDTGAGKGKVEVKLPISRTEEYLRELAKWPRDLRQLELALGARGRNGIISTLTQLGNELTVLVQVGLERRKLIKTDIWKKLPEFVDGLYGTPTAPTAAAAEESAQPVASASSRSSAALAAARSAAMKAETKPAAAPGKPLSKAEQIRQAQMAKLQAGGGAPVEKKNKAEQLIESQKALAKATLEFEEQEAARIQATVISAENLELPTAAAEAPPVAEKPLSKIEQIRAAQLAKSKGTAPPAESPLPAADKPLSKVEQIRAAQMAKANASAPPAAKNAEAKDDQTIAADKPLSKLEQARLQAAARKAQNPDS